MAASETIAAIATPPGHGAIAIVRVSGTATRSIAARVFRSRAALRDRVATVGRVVDGRGATIDEALALLFRAPHSVTGEDVLELHVHGSPAVARETLAAVLSAGARLAHAGEFTRRAYLAGKLDLNAAEAVADLIAAEHRAGARAAAARLGGGLSGVVDALREKLEAVLAELAAALDFPDDVSSPDVRRLADTVNAVANEIDALAATWEHGRLLREGVSVAIVGPPNAGKSSLLNALAGEDRALVSPVAGTTRDTIEEIVSLGDVAARVIDTAGIRTTPESGEHGALEIAGIARARRSLENARIALVVIDASIPASDDAHAILQKTRGRCRVVFYNKNDLGRCAYEDRSRDESDALVGSAFCDADVARVRARLATVALGGERIDLSRPMLASAWHVDAALEARRARASLGLAPTRGEPVDLVSGDLLEAVQALGMLTGRDASEALVDSIFARFCVGK